MTKKQKKLLLRILIAAGLMVLLEFVPAQGLPRFALYMVPYLTAGHDILRKAIKGIRNRQVFDENFLMATATVGAIVLGLSGSGDYTEAVAVMVFYQLGELFQSYAIGKSRRSIAALMDIRPDHANVEQEGRFVEADPEEVAVGSVIRVATGERVPLDGIVLSGSADLDTSALTGESVPRSVSEGDEVFSGCINLTGVLTLRTTREFSDSTVSRILDLVENASSRKSRSEAFISRFSRVYTPAVCGSALALAVLPPVARLLSGLDPQWTLWCYRALTFLVTSCPCALVISIPLSFFAGLGGASSAGVLIKGSNYLEALSQADTVAFDKTGTLTCGSFSVTQVRSCLPREELLEAAALAEAGSPHPISKAIRSAWGGEADPGRVAEVQELGGFGVTALVDGRRVACGNRRLMERLGLTDLPEEGSGTAVHVAIDGRYSGCITLEDTLKPTAKQAIVHLKKAGIRRIVMLTGDHPQAAKAAADQLGIGQFLAQLLPQNKVEAIEGLLGSCGRGKKLIFAGDGINDAPVLARSDIGIAMGAMGSDAAIEAADVVLMDDDPLKIAKAISISRRCMAIVYQNIVFAIGVKLLCLVLVALGMANMWLAIFADVGVMVLAVLNAMRTLLVSRK